MADDRRANSNEGLGTVHLSNQNKRFKGQKGGYDRPSHSKKEVLISEFEAAHADILELQATVQQAYATEGDKRRAIDARKKADSTVHVFGLPPDVSREELIPFFSIYGALNMKSSHKKSSNTCKSKTRSKKQNSGGVGDANVVMVHPNQCMVEYVDPTNAR